ncbi:MAG: flagellar biosynthetic protein FliO [Gammaproteobacteria bacterium]|nr:flagellar biosynthetic protein FliO [Gammaproteobacteria bacterium]
MLINKLPNVVATVILLVGILLFSMDVSAAEHAAGNDTVAIPETDKPLPGSGLSDSNMAGNLAQTTLGLLVVLLVIGAAAWAFKRFGNVHVGAQGRMKIIGGISLGTRERAVLLQVGDQQLVIGVSPGRVQTLYVLDKPVLVEDKPENSTSFSSRLQSAILNRKGDINRGEK